MKKYLIHAEFKHIGIVWVELDAESETDAELRVKALLEERFIPCFVGEGRT